MEHVLETLYFEFGKVRAGFGSAGAIIRNIRLIARPNSHAKSKARQHQPSRSEGNQSRNQSIALDISDLRA
jgi:hypothetical protein